jgi:histidine triad (HIT) family protein
LIIFTDKGLQKCFFYKICLPWKKKTIFEKIINGEVRADIIFEKDIAVIIRGINSQAPIHALIIPKKRIDRIEAAQNDDAELLGKLLIMAKDCAKSHNLTGFRLVINNGQQAGETVPHLHMHLLSGRPIAWSPGQFNILLDRSWAWLKNKLCHL